MPTYPTPPSIDPTIVPKNSVEFSYPYTSPTLSATISRSPDMGNSEHIKFLRVNSATRGGDPIIFWDDTWPSEDVFTFAFSYIPKPTILDFQSFMEQTLGMEIKLVDHESQIWKGFILNPNTEFVNQGLRDSCGNEMFSFSIDFQGVLQSWP